MNPECSICDKPATRICGKCKLKFCDRHRCLCSQGTPPVNPYPDFNPWGPKPYTDDPYTPGPYYRPYNKEGEYHLLEGPKKEGCNHTFAYWMYLQPGQTALIECPHCHQKVEVKGSGSTCTW